MQPKRSLIPDAGTEVRISPLLEGMRSVSGEKVQWYLASELRDRIYQTGVKITVVDRLARKQYLVEPRQYEGRLLHQLPPTRTGFGDVYAELYINEPSDANRVALFRRGTRVIEDLVQIDDFARPPWTLRHLQGHIDAAFVELTPGTRAGVIRDAAYAALREGMRALGAPLIEVIEEQRRAEEERASRDQLKVIQRAFREALLALPAEEYDWFDIHTKAFRPEPGGQLAEQPAAAAAPDFSAGAAEPDLGAAAQRTSSSLRVPFSASPSRRRRASSASASVASCAHFPATDRGAGSSAISSSNGASSRVQEVLSARPAKPSSTMHRPSPAWRGWRSSSSSAMRLAPAKR